MTVFGKWQPLSISPPYPFTEMLATEPIVVDSDVYRWKRGHIHERDEIPKVCAEKVAIYLDGVWHSPAHLYFREADNALLTSLAGRERWNVGYPEAGVLWLSPDGATRVHGDNLDCPRIDLNSSRTIAKLIQYCLRSGWRPGSDRAKFVVKHALRLVDELDLAAGSTQ